MGSSWEDVEWAADCLRERMDSIRADADDAGKTYAEIRKRAEKRGAEATVRPNGVSVFWKGKTKTVRTHEDLDAFLGARGDADDPCWEGYEQAGTKEKDGRTVPNCVEADEQRADDGYFGTLKSVHDKSSSDATERDMRARGAWNVPLSG